jgi:glycosyltransferase involved in cell wall biosynthesis
MASPTDKYKVLIAHNRYQQLGGEDTVVDTEGKLLKDNGHDVLLYLKDNSAIDDISKMDLLTMTLWSKSTVKEVSNAIDGFKPDIIHVHNTFPLLSPSIYWVAAKHQVPVVQTIHNFRLSCLQASFLRNEKICLDCLGHVPWKGVIHKCYKKSYKYSAVLAMMLQFHKLLGTYKNKVPIFIALNGFCKNKLIEMGLPKEKIHIKPNFVDVNNMDLDKKMGNPLFVGRISTEKGIQTLAKSIKKLPSIMFDIVGDGPEKYLLKKLPNVRLLGLLNQDSVYRLMRKAPFLILPSICYENMPRTLVESFGNGTPIIASNRGALSELIEHKKTGLLFDVGSSDHLKDTVLWAFNNPERMLQMGINAKNIYMQQYTSQSNYQQLMTIYNQAYRSVKR